MPIYHDSVDVPEPSPYGGILADSEYDREILFAEIHGSKIDVFAFTDWLATMRKDEFWTFPKRRGQDGIVRETPPIIRYTVGQQLFIEDIWREFSTDWRQNKEQQRPNLLQHLYQFRDLPVLMYTKRHAATSTGYSHDSREQLVEFDSVMDMMVRFVVAQLPFLRVLHELDQARYEATTPDDVREVVRRDIRTNREPFEAWAGEWVQYHIRAVIRQAQMKPAKRGGAGLDDDDDSGGPENVPRRAATKTVFEPSRLSPYSSTTFEP